MCMLDRVREKREEIYVIARRNHAEKVWLFGSCARREDRPESDVDFLVSFNPDMKFGDPLHLSDALEALFNRKVDVVSDRGLSPYIGQFIMKERVVIASGED